MSQDIYVKEVEVLAGFASDVRRSGGTLAGHCAQLSTIAFSKESELRGYIHRIESALRCAQSELREAEYEYEYYVNNTDAEDYSASHAYALKDDMMRVRARCQEIEEDLNYAEHTLTEALFVLQNLLVAAQAAGSRIDGFAQSAAHSVNAAVHDIIQYKSIK